MLRVYLDKWSISKLGEAPGYLSLATACGANHEDVLWYNLFLRCQQPMLVKSNKENHARYAAVWNRQCLLKVRKAIANASAL